MPRPWITVSLLVLLGAAIAVLGHLGPAVILALGYYALCVVKPDTALAWAFLALPWASFQFQVAQFGVQPFELFVWPACLGAAALTLADHAAAKPHLLKQVAPLVLMGGYFSSLGVLLWGDRSMLEIRMWMGSLLFALLCYLRYDRIEFRDNLERALPVSAMMLALVGLSQHLFGVPGFQGVMEPRDLIRLFILGDRTPVRLANLTFNHFNSAGAYAALLVATLFPLAMTRRTPGLVAGFVGATVALYLTYSRGATAGAAVSIIVSLIVLSPRRFRVAFGTLAVGILFAGTLVVVPLVLSSLDYVRTLSLGVRAMIWRAYIGAWIQSPVTGLGPGNGFAAARFLSPFGAEYGAHNNLLYIAADYGLVGVLVLTYGFGAVAWRIRPLSGAERRSYPFAASAIAALVALAVHSMVDDTLTGFSYRAGLMAVTALGLRACTDAQAEAPRGVAPTHSSATPATPRP